MSREIRYVPKDWKHPKKQGKYIPLNHSFPEELRKWKKEEDMWKMGLYKDLDSYKEIEEEYRNLSFPEWYGDKPIKGKYMPEWRKGEKTHIQMYENISEGTPISPVMETPEALAQWCVDNEITAFANIIRRRSSITANYEWWLNFVNEIKL